MNQESRKTGNNFPEFMMKMVGTARCAVRMHGGSSSPLLDVTNAVKPLKFSIARRSGRSTSLPADLAAFVLLLQPGLQWLEVFGHRACRNVFTSRFLQNSSPIFRIPFFQNVIQPRTDFFVVGVVTGLRRLMQNFARDVIVQLKLKHGRERVVIIVGWIVVDMGLGRGIAKLF